MLRAGFVSVCMYVCLVHLNVQVVNSTSLRSDDPTPLEAVVQHLSSTVLALEAKVTSQEDRIAQLEVENKRRVAFSVYISTRHPIPASAGSIVPFGAAISNVDLAFNTATSVFTCPFDGDYFFAISLDVSPDYDNMSLQKNGHTVVVVDRDDTVSTHLSATAILTLKAGDTVTVVQNESKGHVDEGNDCTFTGFLVK